MTNLDETLTTLLQEVPEQQRPSRAVMLQLRKAITGYLETLPSVFIEAGSEIPPRFDLTRLGEQGINLTGRPSTSVYDDLVHRRRLLLALIRDDGWEWEDLDAGEYDHLIRSFQPS